MSRTRTPTKLMVHRTLDVLVVGGANIDYLARCQVLPGPGETRRGEEFLRAGGGKGANQAVAAARLGAHVALIARLGDDAEGREILRDLAQAGIDITQVTVDPRAATGTAVIQIDGGGEKRIIAIPGANAALKQLQIERALTALPPTRVLLTCFESGVATAAAAIHALRPAGTRVVLDPSPAEALDDALLWSVDVIRPDAGEARILTGIEVGDRPSARAAARQLLERGAGAVIIQAGTDGDLLVERTAEHWLPRLPVHSIDATGAGDAFAATVAARLAHGRPLVEAARWGSAAAALATTRFGAQAGLATSDGIAALLKQHDNQRARIVRGAGR